MSLSQPSPFLFDSHRCGLLLSAATDGKIALWDVIGTTSLLAGNWSQTSAPSAPCLTVSAHQSGVNSLAVWQEKTEDGCLVTIASGGDDGQLTVSVVKVQYPELKTDSSRVLSHEHHHLLVFTLLSQSRDSLAHSAPPHRPEPPLPRPTGVHLPRPEGASLEGGRYRASATRGRCTPT